MQDLVGQYMFALLALSPGDKTLLRHRRHPQRRHADAFSIYPLLSQRFRQEGVSAAALVAATTASFFTVAGCCGCWGVRSKE